MDLRVIRWTAVLAIASCAVAACGDAAEPGGSTGADAALAGTDAALAGADAALADASPSPFTNVFADDFDAFATDVWSCEYSCPTVTSGHARFTLAAGVPPDQEGSWSKIRYRPHRFTSGRFTVRFALTERPDRAVWWGAALWDTGPAADESEFSEINFGYTTDESFSDTQLYFESARRGHAVSVKIDTGVDLYDGAFHTAVLEYDAAHVSLYFDGALLHTITDASVIPIDPMDFVLGPRLVTGAPTLDAPFVESVDAVELAW
jgi:beta-glucanase (GH16 family)